MATFARHGFTTLLKATNLTQFLPVPESDLPPGASANAAALRTICEELGPTFIKLGQIASTRSDLLPKEYLEELRKLQDSAMPVDHLLIRQVIEEELGEVPEALFASFEEEPRAAASLGQVHGAMLKDGSQVVLKVQRPGVVERITSDLEILKSVALWIDRHSEIGKKYDLPGVVEDFSTTLVSELSYMREGRNAERLSKNLKSDTDTRAFYIPKVHWEFTTDRVICWEELVGWKIEEIDEAEKQGIHRSDLARDFMNGYLQQIFIDGYYHADPHPGN
ncbi:MAG TPA: AarF/UbiB family protein, partial [Candidatus Xenobia bacterium]